MKQAKAETVPQRGCETARLTAAELAKLDGCLKKHWKRYRKMLKRAQKDSSEEPVHDSRVEARRLLAVTDLLLPLVRGGAVERIEKLLKRYLDLSDALRDTQVQLLAVAGLQESAPGFREFAAFLRNREQRLTKKTRRKLKSAKTGKLEKLIDLCRKDLKTELKKHPPAESCRRLMGSVERAFGRTRKLFARINPHDTTTIHRTRVSFKKFRYMAEALAELLPGIDADYTSRLRAHQGLMGEIQDREVLVESFSQWALREQPKMDWALRAQAQLKAGGRRLVRAYLAESDKLLDFWPLPSGPPEAERPATQRKTASRFRRSAGEQGDGSMEQEGRNK
jgi:CHAD domain-containing protein